jgi:hypothetical protein
MKEVADTALGIARNAVRVAAAIFLLAFMVGDLFFPQYFCEEYVVYATDKATIRASLSEASAPASFPTATSATNEETLTPQLGPIEFDGDYCLHILHRSLFSVAETTSKRQPPGASPAPVPPSVEPNSLYHPPRSL